MNNETQDPLARWWWPGQWLHIVYGVWIDQLWYWKNVRSRLRGKEQGWGIFIQGIFGTALVELVVWVILGALLSKTGIQVKWGSRALTIALGVIAAAILGCFFVLSEGLPRGIVHSIVTITMTGLFVGIIPLLPSLGEASWAAIGMLVGIAAGINTVLCNGVVTGSDKILALILGVVLGVLFTQISVPAHGIVMGVAVGLGFYFGEDWATRQVPDTETRKRFANPDLHSKL